MLRSASLPGIQTVPFAPANVPATCSHPCCHFTQGPDQAQFLIYLFFTPAILHFHRILFIKVPPLQLVSLTQQQAFNPLYIQCGINALACWKASAVSSFCLLKRKNFYSLLSPESFFSLRKWYLHIIQAEHAMLPTVGTTGVSEGIAFGYFVCFLQILLRFGNPINAVQKVIITYCFVAMNVCRIKLFVQPEQIWD